MPLHTQVSPVPCARGYIKLTHSHLYNILQCLCVTPNELFLHTPLNFWSFCFPVAGRWSSGVNLSRFVLIRVWAAARSTGSACYPPASYFPSHTPLNSVPNTHPHSPVHTVQARSQIKPSDLTIPSLMPVKCRQTQSIPVLRERGKKWFLSLICGDWQLQNQCVGQ